MQRREFINRSAILGAALVSGQGLLAKESGLISSLNSRDILQVLNPHHTRVGTLPIIRLFPGGKKDFISPFVLFDEFGPVNMEIGHQPLRVNAHPHAGIVPTSYFVAGSGHHKDSMNFDLQVGQGEFMMFNSGRGAIHMEETGRKMHDEGGKYHGFQIWLNLPAKHKFVHPNTFIHKGQDIPEIITAQYTIKVILGHFGDHRAKAYTYSSAFYYHIKTKPNTRLTIPTDPTHNAFIYNMGNTLELKDSSRLKINHMAVYQRGSSDIEVYTRESSEFLLLGGEPLNDQVVSYGPFVMNTEEQIKQCIVNYRTGKMGNPELVN